jgi:predicted ArsR family transcriptional regulator
VAQEDLPDDVQKLIAEHITSIEQLEILLLLRSQPNAEWTAESVSEELRTSARAAAARLQDLHEHGLLARRRDGEADRFRFEPSSGRSRAVDRLATAYAQRRYTVIDLIFSKPIDRLRVYADAFRFKRDDSNG